MTTSPVPSITDEQIARLDELCAKATPGPWWIDSHGHMMVSEAKDHAPIFQAADLVKPAVRHPETGNLSHWPNDWDATFIANANPATVAALIARLRAAEKELSLWAPVIDEVHRRADKECCLADRCDFTVTVMHDDYAAIDAAMSEAKP